MRSKKTFDAMMDNPEWLGFGYLNSRKHLPARARRWADEFAIEEIGKAFPAHKDQALFDFANSKLGRWFGEETLNYFGTDLRRPELMVQEFVESYDAETREFAA